MTFAMRFAFLLFPFLGFVYRISQSSAAPVGRAVSTNSPFLIAPSTSNIEAKCVTGEQWPDWGGEIDYQNCWEALATLRARVPRDHPYVFWSGTVRDMPPPSMPWPWKLPAHSNTGKLDYPR